MDAPSSNPHLKKVFDWLVQTETDSDIPVCDAIFTFGTSNGDVARHAATLYLARKASRIIVSGMYGSIKTEGPEGFGSEAEYFASIMEKLGVQRSAMILESKARNSYENVIFGMKECADSGFYPKSLILVCVPYLLRRAKACFVKNFPEIKTYGSAMPVNDAFFSAYRVGRIKGELPRLVDYAKGGTIAPTEIPQDIIKAAARF